MIITHGEVNRNDVLGGRGGKINAFPGNVQFRDIVKTFKEEFYKSKKLEKIHVVDKVLQTYDLWSHQGDF